jgi:hypothetical protein
VAAKSKVASTSKKAAVKKATGKARGRPKGLQLNAAQAKAYNKAFTATAQKLSHAATVRAFATGLRKYRLQAANSTVRAYNKARGNAQVAAIAAHAASQSLMQSRLGHQNAALLARIGQDAFRHTTLLGRMQFAQAGVKVYAHRAVMNTVTQKQAVSIETKFLSKVVKTAKKAGARRGRPKGKGTPLSKSIGAAATAAGKAAAAKVPGTATTRATGKAGPKSARAVKANVKASSKAAGASKKAPVKAAKTRTAPNFAAQAAAYGHALTAMWAGAPADGKALVKNYPSQRDWMGDEVTPNCIVTAIANHLLHARSVVASEKELKELDELAGPEPTIEEVLWQVYLTGWPGRAVHLGNYREVDDELETENLVIGFEVRTDDGWADHCALALNDCRVVSWGSETDRESLVEEAWELTWLVLERPASRWSWRLPPSY